MIPLLDHPDNPIVTECVLCKHTLGHDSREQGWITCPAHRSCNSCGMRVAMPEDLRLRYNDLYERNCVIDPDSLLIHPRCLMLRATADVHAFPVTVAQSHYDLLNHARLSGQPDMSLSLDANIDRALEASRWWLSTMSFEEKLRHIQIMEAVLTQTLLASKVTKIEVKATAEKIATSKKTKAAIAGVSMAVIEKPTATEISKPQYMELSRWRESFPKQWIALSESQKAQMKQRDKAIGNFMKALSLPRESATDLVDGTNTLPWMTEK